MDTKEKDAMDTDANAEVESSDSEDDAVEEGKSNKQQADDDDEPPEEAANSDPVADPRNLKPFTGDSLPYDLSSLSWDASHRRNKQNKYCYCGNPRTQWTVMLKCASCKQLFHIECLKKRPAHPPLPGEGAYTFKCCICTKSDAEYCELLGKSWTDVVRVAIYNLLLQEKRKGNANLRKFFQYKEEICNFIDKHWDQLCHGKTRTKTWENTIGSSLSTKSHYFASGAEVLGQAGFWGLKSDSDPSSFTKSGSSASVKKDKSKKKLPKGVKKKRGNDALSFLPEDLPSRPPKVRKPSSSAAPAAAPVLLPKQFFDAKSYGYTKAVLAKENSALQVKIANDQLTVTNEKGYRMARASAGVTEGAWYFEIECLPHNGNTRLGWCTEKGDVQAPVGFDIYSYSYRDKLGTKFHQSRGREYGDGYGPGDTLGFYINLPPKKENANVHQKDSQPQVIVAPSGKKQQEPDRLIGSEIIFFKNGANQGIAFSNIYEGTYYPAASLYMGGTVKFNFGPNFKYPPKDIKYRPLCELEEEMKAAVAEAARVAKQEAAAQVAAQAAAQAAQAAPAPEGSANNNNAETNGAHQAAQPAAAPAEVKS